MKNDWPPILTLTLIQFIDILDFMIMMPMMPMISRDLNLSPEEFSLLVISYTVGAAITALGGAFFLDRFDRKKVLQIAFAILLTGTFLCGIVDQYYLLLPIRFVTGASGGIMGTMVMSVVGDLVRLERRAFAMSMVMMGFSLASVIGVPVGLYLANEYGWQTPYLMLGAGGVVVWIIMSLVIPSMTKHMERARESGAQLAFIKTIPSSRSLIGALLLTVSVTLGHFTIIPFLSGSMSLNGGIPERDLDDLYFYGGIMTIIASPIIGKLANRFGRLKIFMVFNTLVTIPIFLITQLGPSTVGYILFITCLFFILSPGRFVTSMTMATSVVPTHQRATFMALRTGSMHIASSLGGFLAGKIVIEENAQLLNYNIVGYIAIGFTLLALIFAPWLIEIKDEH